MNRRIKRFKTPGGGLGTGTLVAVVNLDENIGSSNVPASSPSRKTRKAAVIKSWATSIGEMKNKLGYVGSSKADMKNVVIYDATITMRVNNKPDKPPTMTCRPISARSHLKQ
jgi:hypothetical protein